MNTHWDKLQSITVETTFLLSTPAGEVLELLLSPAPPRCQVERIAIICHPHPLYGGTMHNKVVTTLAKICQQLNMQTIRFNFRGVGQSTGNYSQGLGEQEDLLTVMTWVKQQSPQAQLWLVGFSFGAYVSIRVAATQPIAGLISVAPPVNHFPLDLLPIIHCPWIVVQGDQDDVVPSSDVESWLATLPYRPKFIILQGAGHFFHGQLTVLKTRVLSELL